jgi:regulator of protease activity HflC (stomatin/prohibitin superfamily)
MPFQLFQDRNSKLFILFTLFSVISGNYGFMHNVQDGYVGITRTAGKINDMVYPAGGPYFYTPLYQSMEDIEIRPQTDEISKIKCGTKEGLNIMFPTIRVFNQLRHDDVLQVIKAYGVNYDNFLITQLVTQKVTEMCSEMTLEEIYNTQFANLNEMVLSYLVKEQERLKTNLIINSVVLFKPEIPREIQRNYDLRVEEKTRLQAERDSQARKLEEAQTQRLLSEQEELKKKMQAQIAATRQIEEKETEARLRKIEVDSLVYRKKTEAQAEAEAIKILADAEKDRLTPEYLQKHWQEHVLSRAEAYWGDSLPKYLPFSPSTKQHQ